MSARADFKGRGKRATASQSGYAHKHAPLLTAGQEILLGRAIRRWQDWEGGPQQAPLHVQRQGQRALDRFLLSNIRLAYHIARKFINRGVEVEDLVQAALEGLAKAYCRFDPGLGYRSSGYAMWYGMQACQSLVASQGTGMRLPNSFTEKLGRASRISRQLTLRLNRSPTPEEIDAAAEWKEGTYRQLQTRLRQADVLSLDKALSSNGHGPRDATIGEFTSSGEDLAGTLEQEDLRAALREFLAHTSTLSDQQRYILQCRFFQNPPLPLTTLASRLDLHRNTARHLEKTALQSLRQHLPVEIQDLLQQT